MRPTTLPPRSAMKYSASPCVKNGFCFLLRKILRSRRSGGDQIEFGELPCSRYGSSMNSFRSRLDATGRTTTDSGPDTGQNLEDGTGGRHSEYRRYANGQRCPDARPAASRGRPVRAHQGERARAPVGGGEASRSLTVLPHRGVARRADHAHGGQGPSDARLK